MKKINHIRVDQEPVALCGYVVQREKPYKNAFFCQKCVEITVEERNRLGRELSYTIQVMLAIHTGITEAMDRYDEMTS